MHSMTSRTIIQPPTIEMDRSLIQLSSAHASAWVDRDETSLQVLRATDLVTSIFSLSVDPFVKAGSVRPEKSHEELDVWTLE